MGKNMGTWEHATTARAVNLILGMVAEFTKWKFKKGTFFPQNLNYCEENSEKISPFYSFLENGRHKIGFAIFAL